MALSEFKISKAKPKDKPYKLADGGGLFLLVNRGGSKLWRQKYRHMGKERWILLDLSAPLHERPINEITSAEVLYLLKSIEKSGRRETAKKMRSEISAVFRLAVVTLRAEGDPTSAIKDALIPPKVKSRAAIIDEKKFGQLLRDLDEYTGWRIVVEVLTFQILDLSRFSAAP